MTELQAKQYITVHRALRRELGLPESWTCAHCPETAKEWAYDHRDPNELTDPDTGCPFSRNTSHYIPLCMSCHRRFDFKKFAPPHCRKCGTERTPRSSGGSYCRPCKRRREFELGHTKRLGIGLPADRTYCPREHPYSEENTFVRLLPDGSHRSRTCRQCERDRHNAANRAKRKAS